MPNPPIGPAEQQAVGPLSLSKSAAHPGPLVFKGYLATVTLHPDRVQIDRSRMGRINGNESAAIAWQQLVGIDFVDPTRAINGHVHFATAADPRGLTASGHGNRMAAAARNPHAIMFTWQQRTTYHQLRDHLLAAQATAPAAPIPAAAPAPDMVGELAKLHALHQQGALTTAEFEQAKARLLGT